MIKCEINKNTIKMEAAGSLADLTTDVFRLISAVSEHLPDGMEKAYIGTLRMMLVGLESGRLDALMKELRMYRKEPIMNTVRRKNLSALLDRVSEIRDALEEIMGEEEEYRDNMPENLQGSERYERASEVCDSLYSAVSDLESVVENLESAIE